MDKEFNEWVARSIPASRPMTQGDMVYLKAAWLEATRRADKRAREECAEICDALDERHYNVIPDECAKAIRATIAEDK